MKTSKRNSRWLVITAAALLVLALSACKGVGVSNNATPTVEPTQAAPTPTLYALAGATTTASGLQYLEETAGTGAAPKPGNLISMNYVASLTDGTELVNTTVDGGPVTTVWGAGRLIPGWEQGIGMMKAGGKSKIVIPADLAFGEEGSGSIPPNAQIVLEIELLSVEEAPMPSAVDSSKLTTSETGLQYYDLEVGDGAEAAKNSTVVNNYKLWLKTDTGYTFLEQSDAASPLSFVVGAGDTVFPGWDEGATGMKVGGKRLLVIPPDLALGDQSNSVVPANSTLVMEIEVTEVKEPRVATKVDEKDYTSTDSGLKYYDLVAGTGATPQNGQTVVVHYTGWLTDGTQFDSSVDSGQPFSFVLGAGSVIPGWDEGLATMKVGGKRQLVIPPALGYGDQDNGSIPAGSTLIFEVELIEVQ